VFNWREIDYQFVSQKHTPNSWTL